MKSDIMVGLEVRFAELLVFGEQAPAAADIIGECLNLARMLLEKNRAYGNSALEPVRIMSRDLPTEAGILVRMDDKLSRLQRGHAAGEDPARDFVGYWILLQIARKRESLESED